MRFVSLLPLLVLAAPAAAQNAAPPSNETRAAEKKVCRAGQSTGTIIPAKRICRTKAEWQQIDGANRDANRRFHDNASGGGGFNGPRGS